MIRLAIQLTKFIILMVELGLKKLTGEVPVLSLQALFLIIVLVDHGLQVVRLTGGNGRLLLEQAALLMAGLIHRDFTNLYLDY